MRFVCYRLFAFVDCFVDLPSLIVLLLCSVTKWSVRFIRLVVDFGFGVCFDWFVFICCRVYWCDDGHSWVVLNVLFVLFAYTGGC